MFRYRPLAAACSLFILCLFAAYFLPLSLGFILAALFGAIALFLAVWGILDSFPYWRLVLFLCFLGISLGCLRAACEQKSVQRDWDALYEQTAQTEFTVKEILYTNTYGSELLVDVHTANGEYVNSTAVLRGESMLPFYVGDRISAVTAVHTLDYEAFGENFEYRCIADGAKALLVLEDGNTVSLQSSGANTLQTKLLDLRAVLSHRIARIVGGEEGNLLAAMLLGNKQMLSEQTARDFRTAGVSHLLALSGLHLVILVGLIDKLLQLFGAGKRLRIAVLLPLCVFYLMLTGCNYSLLRAMIMLGFVYLSALLREDNDSLTSLLLGGTVILLFAPYAIFSVSFQMTMLATFGILAFSKIQLFFASVLPKGKGIMRFLWRGIGFLCSSLLLSVSTTVALLPVLWLTIGSYALMTPISNLLLIPIAPLVLVSAVLVLMLPISFIGTLTGLAAKLVLCLAELCSLPRAVISLHSSYIPYIIIPVILITMILLVIDLKRLYPLAILPAAICMISFVLIFSAFTRMDQSLSFIYRQNGKNEGIILVRGSQAMICDLSHTSLTQLRADWREAQREGASELSVLMLSHYHSKSATSVSRFTQSVFLRELWLPIPSDETQRDICKDLISVAIKREIRITFYDTEKPLTVFDTGNLTLSKRFYSARSVEPAFSLTLSYAENTICYHTASLEEYLAAKGESHDCACDHLILGVHGPIPKKEVEMTAVPSKSLLVARIEYLSFLKIQTNAPRLIEPSAYRYVLE